MRLISAVSGVQVPAPPPFLPLTWSSPTASCATRRANIDGMLPAGRTRCSWRCRAGRTRSRSAPAPRAGRRAGELTAGGLAHLNHSSAVRLPTTTKPSAARWRLTLGMPIVVERVDVRALAREWRTSLEDAGRRARYAFFEQAAALGADADRDRPHARRSGRDVPPAVDPRRRAARALRDPPAARSGVPSAARGPPCRRSATGSSRALAISRRRSERRSGVPAQSGPPPSSSRCLERGILAGDRRRPRPARRRSPGTTRLICRPKQSKSRVRSS